MALKTNPVNFVLAQNAAVVLHARKSNEKTIRGLQGMGLCLGFTMETQTVAEMGRRIALVVPSGGTYEETSVNYNFIPGDSSLEEFRDAAINSTKLADVRLYVKQGCDFSAPDLISDPASGLYVGSMSDPQVDSPNGLFTGSLSYMPGGAFVLFIAHTGNTNGTNLSYTVATRTFTLAGGGSFIEMGFEVGDTLILDNAAGADPYYLKAEAVNATTLVVEEDVGNEATLEAAGDLAAGIASTELHGATPLVVSGYTGLESCD
jgi:hypothetical protein